MLVALGVIIIVAGNLVQAHAAMYHQREPRGSMLTTRDLYLRLKYYTPAGQRLTRVAWFGLYPLGLALLAIGLAR